MQSLVDGLSASAIPQPFAFPPGGLATNPIGSPADLLAGFVNFDVVTFKESLDIPEGRSDAVNRLHEHIATVFGIADPSRVTRALDSFGFVLTSALLVKLLALHNIRRVSGTVILSGDASIGKNDVMALFATLVSLGVGPDLFSELKAAIKQALLVRT